MRNSQHEQSRDLLKLCFINMKKVTIEYKTDLIININ